MILQEIALGEGLERVRIAGFGSLADVTLHPGRLTVLIRRERLGKVERTARPAHGAAHVHGVAAAVRGRIRGGASSLLHYGPKRTKAVEIELDFVQQGKRNRYAAHLGFASGDKLLYLDESVGYAPSLEAELRTESLGTGHWESVVQDAAPNNVTARTVGYWLDRLTFFHFHDTSIASALRTNARTATDGYLRSDGSNLAAYLARLEGSEDRAARSAWKRINLLVARIAPSVKKLAPTPANNDGSMVRLDWIDDQGERFGVHQLSDGTLRAIALVTALAQPTAKLPRFISIDEPELGLHPAAVRTIAELARSVSRHTQVLFATQSTGFLDHFEVDEVVVVERGGGCSRLVRLDPDALRVWLEDYNLSEVFDKGVIGGRP